MLIKGQNAVDKKGGSRRRLALYLQFRVFKIKRLLIIIMSPNS